MKGLKQLLFCFTMVGILSAWYLPSSNESNEALHTTEAQMCIVDLGEDLEIALGDSVEIQAQISCDLADVESIVWEPAGEVFCLDANCLNAVLKPLSNQCYQITINLMDGTTATDEVCIAVRDCEATSPLTLVNSISDLEIASSASVDLSIAQTQFVSIDIIEDSEVAYVIWGGWLKPGDHVIDLDFSAVPAGDHELRIDLYPTAELLSIIKL